jgi:hypothetical protein
MTPFHVRFEGLSVAEANRAAAELRNAIERAGGNEVETSIRKETQETQDFGATLVLILGTEAAIIVAKAIHSYVAKRGDKVVIETEGGKVLATGAAAANIDVAATAEAMRAELDGQ